MMNNVQNCDSYSFIPVLNCFNRGLSVKQSSATNVQNVFIFIFISVLLTNLDNTRNRMHNPIIKIVLTELTPLFNIQA
jgi:hypothetical protein